MVNKANVANIKSIAVELFQQNLLRGNGLFARAIIRAQMASPGFTHIYVALVAIINSKVPQVGKLTITRVILQFRRAYKQNNKIVVSALVKMIAHLVNQSLVPAVLAVEVCVMFFEDLTNDSVELSCQLLQDVGAFLLEEDKRSLDHCMNKLR